VVLWYDTFASRASSIARPGRQACEPPHPDAVRAPPPVAYQSPLSPYKKSRFRVRLLFRQRPFICPDGLIATRWWTVREGQGSYDLGFPDMAPQSGPPSSTPAPCADRVHCGGALRGSPTERGHSATDDHSIAVHTDCTRLYYLSGGTLMTAPLTKPISPARPAAVTVTGVSNRHGLTSPQTLGSSSPGADNKTVNQSQDGT